MPVIADCTSCGSKLTVPDNLLGQEVKCPRCGTIRVVAPASTPPPVLPPQSQTAQPIHDYDDEDDRAVRRTRPSDQRATTEVNGPALGMGIASLVLGIIAIPVAMIPCFGFWSMPVSGVGLALGVSGLIIVLVSKRGNAGFPIAGSAVSFVALAIAGLWLVVCTGIFKGTQASLDQFQKGAEEFARKMEEVQRQDAADWLDASKDAALHEDVQVRVASVTIGPVDLDMANGGVGKSITDNLIILLVIRNVSPEGNEIEYKGWTPKGKLDRNAATLRDNGVFTYPIAILTRPVKGQIRLTQSINPGESLEDVLVYHAPREDPKDLRLELPASAFGGFGTIKFRIPTSMIKR
jgi:hypothetical protein